jgi:nucleoside 2-deoxyribosyltransferase
MNPPERCHITDSPTQNKPSSIDAVEYFTEFGGKKFYFVFLYDHINSDFVKENKYILQGLILNNKFPYDQKEPFYNNEKLEKIIKEAVFPKLPKEKFDNLISYLFSLQEYAGSSIDIYSECEHDLFLKKLYFKNHEEYWFYLNTLNDSGLIEYIDVSSKDGNDAIDIKMTFRGLTYNIELQETGFNSKDCFVAMSFSKSMINTRDAIKQTIVGCGFKPILIDEINYESEITINDAIISNIKSSKFLVADFTEQRHGVYFEAGYALGRGKPVIYICHENDFDGTHFDINHYPHIVYKELDELKSKLVNKIKAWIE